MRVIDRSSKLPLYFQLREYLREQIASGHVPPGGRLPSEQELIERCGVSRITVRQALSDLRRDGLVTRQSGRGTFVTRQKIGDFSQRMGGFMDNLRALGYEPSSEILCLERMDATEVHQRVMDVVPGEVVFRFERLIKADGEPIAISTVHFAAPAETRLEPSELAKRSLVPIAREKFGIVLVRAERTIEAAGAAAVPAKLLAIRRGVPVLIAVSTIYDAHERRRVHINAVYRGDRYKYFISVPT